MDSIIVINNGSRTVKAIATPQETAIDTVAEINKACRTVVLEHLDTDPALANLDVSITKKELDQLIDSLFCDLFKYCRGPQVASHSITASFVDTLGCERNISFVFDRVESLALYCA